MTRRFVLRRGSAGVAAALAAACGPLRPKGAEQPAAQPQEVVWSKQQIGDPQDSLWFRQWEVASQATGVKITPVTEPGADYWTKRQTEFASGSANVDLMTNSLGWVLPGGLLGMFVDHAELMRRDRVETRQYYKVDIDSWSWKGKLWGVPSQSGGEVVLYNKALFDAKGVKFPHKDWTYDDLLDTCRRLNDPAAGKFALVVDQNTIPYMMGTFILNFGGKRLNDARDRALFGDDPNAIRGAQLDVDLHLRHRFTPTAEARAGLPQGQRPMEAQMVAMEFNGLFRRATVGPAIGLDKLDFAPPPKGPTRIQTAAVAGNAWSILALSRAREAAWRVLRWIHTKEGALGPQLQAVAWPPLIWAAGTPQWLDQFKGTRITDCAKVWETAGHDLLPTPEGTQANQIMNAQTNKALNGEMTARDALREAARQLNELFAQRPAAWR